MIQDKIGSANAGVPHAQCPNSALHRLEIVVRTVDPENPRPLNLAQLQEMFAKLSSNVCSLVVTNKLLDYLGAMLNSASDHLARHGHGSLSASDVARDINTSRSTNTCTWMWSDLNVLIIAMPSFTRLLIFKHFYARQVRPSPATIYALKYCCTQTRATICICSMPTSPHWSLQYTILRNTDRAN